MDEEEESGSEGWEECADEDLTTENILCLFCSLMFNDVSSTFVHCQTAHGFSIVKLTRQHNLDCILYIKLVNFIRQAHPDVETLTRSYPAGSEPWQSDVYMHPVIADDPLLQFDVEEIDAELVSQLTVNDNISGGGDGQQPTGITLSTHEYANLMQRLRTAEDVAEQSGQQLQLALTDLQQMRSWAKETLLNTMSLSSTASVEESSSDKLYFESYGHFSIHEEMLKDTVRTCAYRDAIASSRQLFADKVVLDIGCGTGILSMFAAAAGAKCVIGVDQSEIIYQAMDIVRENGLSDKITLLRGKMEEIDLPFDKVDIIISEWMGYFLLFESMLDTVLWARDRYLRPDTGLLLPDRCCLYVAGVSDIAAHRQRCEFWDDVYGFRMSCMKSTVLAEPEVAVVSPSTVVTETCLVKELNLQSCCKKDVEFSSEFFLTVYASAELTAIIGFFDVEFPTLPERMRLSTSPHCKPTHWKQTIFLLPQPITIVAGESIQGRLSCRKQLSDPRSLDITISLNGHPTVSYLMA